MARMTGWDAGGVPGGVTGGGGPAGGVRRAAARVRPWIERFARVGFLAQALVYLVIGGLAVRAARGWGRIPSDAIGALRSIGYTADGAAAWLGALPLIVIAVGAFSYAAWQVVAALTNAGGEGTSTWGLIVRAGRILTAVLYTMLGVGAVGLLSHGGGGARRDAVRRYTADAMAAPNGRWLVGLVGLGIVAYGVYEIVNGCWGHVCERLDLSSLRPRAHRWAELLGRIGTAAHGGVFALIGLFLVRAALDANAHEAEGLGGALRALGRGADGPWLLGAAAVGLVAYGFFQVAQSIYRRLETP